MRNEPYGYWEKRGQIAEEFLMRLAGVLMEFLPQDQQTRLDAMRLEYMREIQALSDNYSDEEEG